MRTMSLPVVVKGKTSRLHLPSKATYGPRCKGGADVRQPPDGERRSRVEHGQRRTVAEITFHVGGYILRVRAEAKICTIRSTRRLSGSKASCGNLRRSSPRSSGRKKSGSGATIHDDAGEFPTGRRAPASRQRSYDASG